MIIVHALPHLQLWLFGHICSTFVARPQCKATVTVQGHSDSHSAGHAISRVNSPGLIGQEHFRHCTLWIVRHCTVVHKQWNICPSHLPQDHRFQEHWTGHQTGLGEHGEHDCHEHLNGDGTWSPNSVRPTVRRPVLPTCRTSIELTSTIFTLFKAITNETTRNGTTRDLLPV